jgi:hypothetical protein
MNEKDLLLREFIMAWEVQWKREMPNLLIDAWAHAFSDVPVDRLRKAMVECLSFSVYPPLPADLRKFANDIEPSAEELAERQERDKRAHEKLLEQVEWSRKEAQRIEEEEWQRRQKLLAEIDWRPQELRGTTEAFLKQLPGRTEPPPEVQEPSGIESAIARIAKAKTFTASTVPQSEEEYEKRMEVLRKQAADLIQAELAKQANAKEGQS